VLLLLLLLLFVRRGMFAKGARKLMQGPPGSIDASYGWGSNNLLWSSKTVINRKGQTRTISPMAKGGRKLQQGPAGSIDINRGWSTNNLLYTWQYKLDRTGSTEVRGKVSIFYNVCSVDLVVVRRPGGAVCACQLRVCRVVALPP
jgi:hypothetical protein